MPSADRLSVRRVALQARRDGGRCRGRVARLAAEAGVELLPAGSDVAEADLVIVLGGDGSVLRALQQVSGSGVPVFGVNFGRVGFLTTAEPDELETAVRRALAGELRVVELATVQVERAGHAPGPGRQRRRGRERRAGAHRTAGLERRRRRSRRAGLRRGHRLHARRLDGLRALGRRAGAGLGRGGVSA